jgi:hypothetical protein
MDAAKRQATIELAEAPNARNAISIWDVFIGDYQENHF